MSADRLEIECHDGYIIVDGCEYHDHGDFVLGLVTAIRQQAGDIAELRAKTDWQIQATKAAIESCNQATTAGLAAVAERDQLRARLAAIEAAPVVARVFESNRDFATGPSRCLAYTNSELPVPGTELIAKPAKDAP